ETAELRLRLAEVFEAQLADLPAAIDQYEQVIYAQQRWEAAVSSLERLVVHEAHRERVAELLEPVYRGLDWWQKLVVILDAKLDYVRDPGEQVSTLHEIAKIHEDRAGKLDPWDEVVATLEDGAASAQNGDLAAGLWARAAEIHEARRGDLPRAIA